MQINLSNDIMLKLYNLGCSFARGNLANSYNHISDKNIGPGTVLSNYLNREEVNLARNGNSLDGILKDLYTNKFEKDSLILIGTPPKVRFYTFSKTHVKKINPLRKEKAKKILRKFQNKDKQAEETIINAFSKGPEALKENYFQTERWQNINFKSSVDLEGHTNYRFLIDLLSIQCKLKSLNLNYIIYNNLADLNYENSNWELTCLKNNLDLNYYFKPYFKIFDWTNDSSPTNKVYRVATGDTHPNHLCYFKWLEEIKPWLESKGIK